MDVLNKGVAARDGYSCAVLAVSFLSRVQHDMLHVWRLAGFPPGFRRGFPVPPGLGD